jgi:hypothetical protein
MLDGVECMETFLKKIKKTSKKQKQTMLIYLLKNLRMTICELG